MGSSGTGNRTNYGTITKPDGTVVQLPAELVYGRDTGSGAVPKSITDFEKKHRNSKIEYLILESDLYGTVGTHKGGSTSVSAPIWEHAQADMTSHNHPRTGDEAGWLSGTFSPQDISVFSGYHKTDRVSAYEGVYSITKGANFDKSIVQDYTKYCNDLKVANGVKVKDIKRRLEAEYKQIKGDFNERAKGMTYQQFEVAYKDFEKQWKETNKKYEAEVNNLANKAVIDTHNWLRNNQKKYGYTYGLTRW